MKKPIILGLILGTMLFGACKRKKDSIEPASTPTIVLSESEKVIALLTAHPWKYVESYYQSNNNMRACDSDDVVTYTTSGDYKTDIGSKSCFDGQKSTTEAWKLIGTDKIVYITAQGRDTVNITFISDSQLLTGTNRAGITASDKYIK